MLALFEWLIYIDEFALALLCIRCLFVFVSFACFCVFALLSLFDVLA